MRTIAPVLCNQAKVLYASLVVSLLFVQPVFPQSTAGWQLTNGAMVHPDYRGLVPKKSDVVFSTRFKRDNAPDVIRAFGATRVEWVYSTDKEYINALKGAAGWFGGTLSANIRLPNDDGLARDFDGNPLVAPWMKGWRAKWVTTTHSDTVKALKSEAIKIIEAGADSIQVDDPLLQLHSAHWGGDFNRATLQGFNEYLSRHPDNKALVSSGLADLGNSDYREFLKSRYGIKDNKEYLARYRSFPSTNLWLNYLRASVRQHFAELRKHVHEIRGKPLPLSMNLSLDKPNEAGWHFFLAEYADYAISETPIANIHELVMRAATARALGVGFVPSLMPRSLADNRVAIATFYALGAQPLVPWDVYDGNDDKGQAKRFFGTPEEYGELYAFVRKNPELFDDTETTAVVGVPIPVDKFRNDDTTRLIRRLVENQVPFAFVLAGGVERKFKIDTNRARRFKILVSVNPDSDFSPEDLSAVRAAQVKQVTANQLTDTAIRELTPVIVVGGIGAVKVYPRANPANGGRNLQIHVVDESRAAKVGRDANCQRRVGLKREYMAGRRIVKAIWYSEGTPITVSIAESDLESAITIRECRLWGVLSLDFGEIFR